MRKALYMIMIVFVAIAVWQLFFIEGELSPSYYHYKHQWEREGMTKKQWELKKVIDKAKLNTYMVGDSALIIKYPDCMMVDSGFMDSTGLVVMHMMTYSGAILMWPEVHLNLGGDSIDVIADKAVTSVEAKGGKVILKDMHNGYFYLEVEDDGNILYQQFVMDDLLISCCGISYPSELKPSVKRLIDLVHEWNPR